MSVCLSVRLTVCLSLSVFLPAMLCCLDWRINVRICVQDVPSTYPPKQWGLWSKLNPPKKPTQNTDPKLTLWFHDNEMFYYS